MLVVRVEWWPGGMMSRAREIARIFIRPSDNNSYNVTADETGSEGLNTKNGSLQFGIEDEPINLSVFPLLAKVFNEATEIFNASRAD
jgi:hypothetical protein